MARSLILSIAGYHVQTAPSADIALHKFADSKFDLVITDDGVPSLNATQFAGMIKELQPETQVMLITDKPQASTRISTVDMVLNKCMEPEQFLEAVGALVARRHPMLVPKEKMPRVN
jgi:DNA-binding response OmpR family regulator